MRALATGLLVLPLFAACSAPVHADGATPTLARNSKVYESACTASNMAQLRSSLRATRVGSQTKAWKALTTILCAPASPANQQYLLGLLDAELQVVSGDLDGETSRSTKKDAVVLAEIFSEGAVFRPVLSTPRGNELHVSFYADEACAASRTFKLTGTQWHLKSIGLGCD